MWKNWLAAIALPGVYLNLIKDYFFQFENYEHIEKGLGSTYFFIPFKHYSGKDKIG